MAGLILGAVLTALTGVGLAILACRRAATATATHPTAYRPVLAQAHRIPIQEPEPYLTPQGFLIGSASPPNRWVTQSIHPSIYP
jgi:hypothetical protein